MGNHKKETLVKLRQEKEKQLMLEQLRRIPIIQVACEKAGISRPTFYRLRSGDDKFKAAIEEAVVEGVAFINDMSEAQVISLIKEKNWPSISFWLKARHPAYKTKVEVDARVVQAPEKLTPEQQELVENALRLAVLPVPDKNHGQETK